MIKVGIIGTGYWGKHHLRIFSKLPCDLVGIADLDPEKENLANEYKTGFFSDYHKLFTEVDGVSIVTPPFTHFKIAQEALKAGKHVLIEKPFVLNKKQAQELIELARKKKKILMVGHIYLYHPAINELKKNIDKGFLGKIYYILSQRLNLGIIRSDVNCLWNFAPHDLSVINYLLGMVPENLSCIGQSFLRKDIEDITFLTLRFPKNILVHLIYSWLHPKKVRELTIVGGSKMAIFDDVSLTSPLQIYDKGVEMKKSEEKKDWDNFSEFKLRIRYGNVITPSITSKEPLEAEAEHFLECITTGKHPRSDGNNGLEIVSILETATKSLTKGGKTVEIKY